MGHRLDSFVGSLVRAAKLSLRHFELDLFLGFLFGTYYLSILNVDKTVKMYSAFGCDHQLLANAHNYVDAVFAIGPLARTRFFDNSDHLKKLQTNSKLHSFWQTKELFPRVFKNSYLSNLTGNFYRAAILLVTFEYRVGLDSLLFVREWIVRSLWSMEEISLKPEMKDNGGCFMHQVE